MKLNLINKINYKIFFVVFMALFVLSCQSTKQEIIFDKEDERIIQKVIDKSRFQDTEIRPQKPEIRPQKTYINYQNLWQEISDNHSLTGYDKDNGLFWHIKWFKENPDYLTRVTKRAEPYLKIVLDEVKKRNLPYELALLPIVESAYYPFAYSHGTASGLWQFIPSTGKLYGLKQNFWVDERRDVVKSTNAALNYLENLYTLFGNWQLAIAAYNSGPGRVQRAIKKNKIAGKKADFWNIKLPEETRGYLPRLLAVAKLIKYPEKYGQTITPVDNSVKVQEVPLDDQLDIALISEFTNLSIDEVYRFNPALNRFATPKNYNLLLPIDKVGLFKANLAKYPSENRVNWVRHKIKSGQSINSIANKYNIDKTTLMQINDLVDNRVIAGDYLLIPIAKEGVSFYTKSLDNLIKQEHEGKQKTIYIVKPGDSLWKIANKFKVSVDNLIRWNKLPSRTLIGVGDELIIYSKGSIKVKTLVENTKIKPIITRTIKYTVKSGDSLWKIATKFKTSVVNIAKWNNLDINKPLQVGQRLELKLNIVGE